MDLHELMYCCRAGDLNRIKFLVEQKEVELNVRDKWDSTPLYYACLCGHAAVVKYLLNNGAKCQANTFDGERCLYGALNSDIRNLLRNYKVVSSTTIRRELYQEFLRRLFEVHEYADVCFVVHGDRFYAHKCVLSARSDYFNDMFLDKWRYRKEIHIKHELVNSRAFRALLQYLYQGRLELHIDYIEDLRRLARQCRASTLTDRIDEMTTKAFVFECSKPGTKVTNLVIETDDNFELASDFGILAEEALPMYMCNWIGASELPFYPDVKAPFADVIFEVDGHRFMCHRAFFCSRSDYFKTLMGDPLHEMSYDDAVEEEPCTSFPADNLNQSNNRTYTESTRCPIIKLRNVTVPVFTHVLYYIYQDYVRFLPEHVYDVLLAADMYLLPGLKRQCGTFIATLLDNQNVWMALRTSRMFELPQLEDQCYQFLAEHIEQVIDMVEFHEIIKEDAVTVQERQDVDSIDIIDNIRFHLTATSMDEAHDKLALIESMLDTLGLAA